jgi:hypothetical protein
MLIMHDDFDFGISQEISDCPAKVQCLPLVPLRNLLGLEKTFFLDEAGIYNQRSNNFRERIAVLTQDAHLLESLPHLHEEAYHVGDRDKVDPCSAFPIPFQSSPLLEHTHGR